MVEQARILAKLREWEILPAAVSDDDLLAATEGTFMLARARLAVSFDDLGKALKESMPGWMKRFAG